MIGATIGASLELIVKGFFNSIFDWLKEVQVALVDWFTALPILTQAIVVVGTILFVLSAIGWATIISRVVDSIERVSRGADREDEKTPQPKS